MAERPSPSQSASAETARGVVLLIGGTGYVGDRMRFALRDAGWPVRLLTRSAGDRHVGEGFDVARGDITNRESLVAAMQGVVAAINLVAIIKEQGAATFENINYQGSVNVVDAARQAGVTRLIQMSAIGAGDLPGYPYLHTKWRAENYVKESGLDWTILRPSIIFGPGDKVQFVGQMADLVKRAPVIPIVGDGRSRFQPIHLDDVSACYARALADDGTIGQTLEIAGPEVLTYEEILDECAATLGKKKRKAHVPVSLMMPAASVMGFIPFIEAPVTTDQLRMLKIDNTTDDNATPRLTGRDPIPFRGNIGYIAGKP
ncbi:MAG TPA: complex I NDUFA9 subunit family protein [Thermomicrobiales bacterium]|nr:complex I NDUFA9 subunit family protein [Thermomicrobiales bacterium]